MFSLFELYTSMNLFKFSEYNSVRSAGPPEATAVEAVLFADNRGLLSKPPAGLVS